MAGGYKVGNAYITVAPSLKGFKQKVEAAIKEWTPIAVKLKPTLDDTGVKAELDRLAADKKVKIDVEVDTEKANQEIGAFARLVQNKLKNATASLGEGVSEQTDKINAQLKSILDAHIHAQIDDEEAIARIEELRAELKTLAATDIRIGAHFNAVEAEAQLALIQKAIDSVQPKVEVEVEVLDGPAKTRLKELGYYLDTIDRRVVDARVRFRGSVEMQAKISGLEARMLELGKVIANPKVDLAGVAKAEFELFTISKQLANIDGKTATAKVKVAGGSGFRGQFQLLIDALSILGPTLVPIFGAATAAVAGFSAALITAGSAAGILGIALYGQIAAMKKQQTLITAASKHIDTLTKGTAAYRTAVQHLNEMQAAFNAQFGVAATALGKFHTAWQTFLADTGGTTNLIIASGLDTFSALLPSLVAVVKAAGNAVAGLIAQFRAFSVGAEFQAFLLFLSDKGPGLITAFGQVIGNLGLGLIRFAQAFQPFSVSITGGLVGLSKAFADWAGNLSGNSSFQSFIDYIHKTGPDVIALFKTLGSLFVDVIRDAAPLGAVTVPILVSFLKVIDDIVRTPLGPSIVGLAIAFNALNRAITITTGTSLLKQISDIRGLGDEAKTAATKALAAKVGFLALGAGVEVLASKVQDSASGAKAGLDILGGALIGLGISGGNPIGAAIGAAAGALQFFAQRSQSAAAAQKILDQQAQAVSDTLNQQTGALTKNTIANLSNDLATTGAYDAAKLLGVSYADLLDAARGNTDAQDRMNASIKAALGPLTAMPSRFRDIAAGIHAASPEYEAWKAKSDAARAAAALLTGKVDTQSASFETNKRRIEQNAAALQAAYGRTHPFVVSAGELSKVYGQLGPDFAEVTTQVEKQNVSVKEAVRLNTALYNILHKLDEQAASKISTSIALINAQKALDNAKGTSLSQQTKEGQANIGLILGFQSAALDRADNFKGILQKNASLKSSNEALFQSIREQFNLSIPAAHKWADSLIHVPKIVKSTAELKAEQATADLKALAEKYKLTPKQVQTIIKTAGTHDAIDNLKAVRAHINEVTDRKKNLIVLAANTKLAQVDIDGFQNGLDGYVHAEHKVTVSAETEFAAQKLKKFQIEANATLNGITDEGVVVSLTAQTSKVLSQLGLPEFGGKAEGGPISGRGTGTSDSIPAMLSNGEHVITAAEVRAAGGHRVIEAIRRMMLHHQMPKFGDIAKYALGGPVVIPNVKSSGLASSAARIQGLFDVVTKGIDSALSKSVNNFVSNMPSGGQLGPGGVLTLAQLARGQQAANSQVGKPYIWGGVGPNGYDCSGFQSYVLNSAMGSAYPYSRRGTTASMPWPYSAPGGGRYSIGWTPNWSNGIGHTSGNIGGLNVESNGSDGVVTGSRALSPIDPHFTGLMHYDTGGVARGRGYLPKNIIAPERVLGPRDTQNFERLVDVLDRGGSARSYLTITNWKDGTGYMTDIAETSGAQRAMYAVKLADMGRS